MPQPSDALDLRRADEGVLLDALEVGPPARPRRGLPPVGPRCARRRPSADEQAATTSRPCCTTPTPSCGPPAHRRSAGGVDAPDGVDARDRPAPRRRHRTRPRRRWPAWSRTCPHPTCGSSTPPSVRSPSCPTSSDGRCCWPTTRACPTSAQEPGAARALARALRRAGRRGDLDRRPDALQEDGCEDLDAVGDWCLGLATSREEAEVDAGHRAARRLCRDVTRRPSRPTPGRGPARHPRHGSADPGLGPDRWVPSAGSPTRTAHGERWSAACRPADEDAADTAASRSGDAARPRIDATGRPCDTHDPFAADIGETDPFGPPASARTPSPRRRTTTPSAAETTTRSRPPQMTRSHPPGTTTASWTTPCARLTRSVR